MSDKPSLSDGEKYTILIVDDEKEILEPYSSALSSAGFRVLTASNGAEGVAVAKAKKPDLILMDLKMPILDGMDATMELKNDPATRDIRVVFLTAFGNPITDLGVAHSYQAIDFIKKGISLEELAQQVKKYF